MPDTGPAQAQRGGAAPRYGVSSPCQASLALA
ncbi:MAG: hypothetical protein BWZ09_01787 [Alphaproteobacteria bacterium ADurb.BinA305]|nr:MAG: hypothetical protein BWZ09_01787 [Alphaproteobacteria bacterium ADurb.BinA305]